MKVKLLVNAVSLSKIHTLSGSANAICLLELWIPIAHFNFHGLGKAREKGGRWGKGQGNWGNAKNPFTIRHVHVGWVDNKRRTTYQVQMATEPLVFPIRKLFH